MQQYCGDLTRRLRSGVVLAGVLFLATVGFLVAKDFVKPSAKPAATYPLHDQHSDEKVAAGVDPYDEPEKAQIFNVKWAEQGFLPIFLVVTNDSDQPVSLSNMQAQLITSRREKIPAAGTDELYRRLAHPNASRPKYPLPFPRTTVKGAVGKKALDEMDAAQFSAKAVEPHSTQAGFVFFDVSGISSPLEGARFYLTGLRDGKGSELLYFEIPFQK
ncbi:MAG TPA: hypothetical protein VEU94_01025 [Terriglobales bacterium]|nr:hypothetical protein [Terriglobales bacterium]